MDRDVLVPLLKTVVLADIMQVVASDNDGPLHLHFGHHTCRPHRTKFISTFSINNAMKTHTIYLDNYVLLNNIVTPLHQGCH